MKIPRPIRFRPPRPEDLDRLPLLVQVQIAALVFRATMKVALQRLWLRIAFSWVPEQLLDEMLGQDPAS